MTPPSPPRTTLDGDLELVQKPDEPRPASDPFGASAGSSGAPSGGAGGGGYGGSGGYGSGGHGGYGAHGYAQLDPLATGALICGVLGILMICCCGLFTLVLSPLAIILGGISLMRIKDNPETLSGAGMAWAGIGTGVAGVVFWFLYLIFAIVMQLPAMMQQY
jgi:hypothetical protein